MGDGRDSELGLERDAGLAGVPASAGSDDDHTVRCAGSVDRSRRGVLEDGHALDVGRVDGVEVACRDGHAVQDVQRRGPGIDRVGSSDGHRGRLARLAGG